MAMPPFYMLLGLLFFFSCLHTQCSSATAASGTLTAGQALAVGDKLVSSNGKFALGFFQPAAAAAAAAAAASTNLSKSLSDHNSSWYLGIWFNKIPACTTVWVANREHPITVTDPKLLNQTQLKISSDGSNLVIVNHADAGAGAGAGATDQSVVIWPSSTHNVSASRSSMTIAALNLENSGNLTLTSSEGAVLWQSFDYPTDVYLPGAKIGLNKVTGLSRQAISRKSLADPGLGSYSVELDATGVVLRRRRDPSLVYWFFESSGASLLPLLKSFLESNPQTKGLIIPAYVDNNQEQYYMYTSPPDDESSSPTFISLGISGQIMVNVWSQAKQSWQTVFTQPASTCTPSATCGPFTVCNGNARPSCECMESFSIKSPQDWEFEDRTGGCIRHTPLHCSSHSSSDRKNTTASNSTSTETDMFHPIARVTLPYNSKSVEDANDQSKCEEACLSSCSCTAYSFTNSRCSVWHGELLSVNLNDGGIDNSSEDVLYLRLAANDLPSLTRNRRKPLNIAVAAAAASISCFGLLMLLVLLLVFWRRNKFKWLWCGSPLYKNQDSDGGIIAFRYTDLVHATKNFSEKLGAGGFGSVYKGVLLSSSDASTTYIAVKRLDGVRQGEKQFRAEVSSIGLIQHVNLVKLIGFCCEGDHRLLVYEHMLNGSLESHLSKSSNAGPAAVLNWNTRYEIALGVARGLSYLHQSCRDCIIHCDIKPENLLLDASFVPKIADFGMAAFVGRDFSRVLTTFRGTAGYLAPEWLTGVAITPKVDVYAFGMVLLEIMAGRRNSPPQAYTSTTSSYHVEEYFPVRAIGKLRAGDVPSLVDPRLHGDFSLEQAERVCKVACWCIQDDESDRPTMGEVVRFLDGLQEIDIPPMPRLLAALTERSDAILFFQTPSDATSL